MNVKKNINQLNCNKGSCHTFVFNNIRIFYYCKVGLFVALIG